MAKKSNVSIDFDEKSFKKSLNKQLAKFDKKMKCPACDKKVTFKFRNYKANCPKCGVEFTQNRK